MSRPRCGNGEPVKVLTESQLEGYWRSGYVSPIPAVSADEVAYFATASTTSWRNRIGRSTRAAVTDHTSSCAG